MFIYRFFIGFLLCLIFPLKAETLTIGTTLSVDSLQYLIGKWQESIGENKVKTVNRTAFSLEKLLMQPNDIDIIFSSSPILLQSLKENGKLAELPDDLQQNNKLVPESLNHYSIVVAFSGFGILYNEPLLKARGLGYQQIGIVCWIRDIAVGLLLAHPLVPEQPILCWKCYCNNRGGNKVGRPC